MAYFANSTEGDILDQQCADCILGRKHCPVANVQLVHNYDQCGIPKLREAMNLLVNEQGICQLRPLLDPMPPQVDEGDTLFPKEQA